MAFVYADRVKEQSASLGLGNFVLTGAIAGFRTFLAGMGDANSCYYTIVNEDNTWEVGICTITGPTISRDTVLSSSSGGAKVNFAAGTKTVFSSDVSQLHANTMTEALHAAIDHQVGVLGVPAPETFAEPDHALLDHSSQLGVPGPETFINSGGEPDHATTDHTGILGVAASGPSTPTQWGINRVSALTVFNLTAATEGIHFLSMDAAGVNLGVLSCNLATAPNDDYPFLVIFNEDANSKGAVINVFGLASAPLISLGPRQGCRLWHTGATTNEYQVERIVPQNGVASEILRFFYGDTLATNTWFTKIANAATNTQTPLDHGQHSIPILSPTRFMAISWVSQTTGTPTPTSLAILDEAEVVLGSPTLPIGFDGFEPLNFQVNPVAGLPSNTTKSINLKYLSGGDKADTTHCLYGFSRDGGLEMHWTSSQTGAFGGAHIMANGMLFPSSFSTVNPSAAQQVAPVDCILDRLTVITGTGSTIDIDILVGGNVVDTLVGVTTVTGEALLINLATTHFVPAGTTVAMTFTQLPLAAPFPDEIHITARLSGAPGFLIPFGGDLGGSQRPRLGGAGNGNDASTTNYLSDFIMRILKVAWITEESSGAIFFQRNGGTVSTFTPAGTNTANVEDTAGVIFSAGDSMRFLTQGGFWSSEDTHLLVYATAIQSTEGVAGGGGGGGGGGGTGLYLQRERVETAADIDFGAFTIPDDNTIPQDTEGYQLFTIGPITPSGIGTKMIVRAYVGYGVDGGRVTTLALFNNKSPDAFMVTASEIDAANQHGFVFQVIEGEYETVDLLPLTFQLRMGLDNTIGAGNAHINAGENGNSHYSGTKKSWMEVIEASS
jgi:hypothetical protein